MERTEYKLYRTDPEYPNDTVEETYDSYPEAKLQAEYYTFIGYDVKVMIAHTTEMLVWGGE